MLGIYIPTMNHSDFVERLLNYYVSVNCPYKLYIGDSSDQNHRDRILAAIDRLSSRLKVKYIYIDPELKPHQVSGELIKAVEEKYCAFSGDDDFLVPTSIGKCITFLEENPAYSTAHGHGVVFTLEGGKAYGRIHGLGSYNLGEVISDSARQRLIDYFRVYWPTDFSVRRTVSAQSIADTKDAKCSDYVADNGFSEMIYGGQTVMQGKIKKLDCLYVFRQDHPRRFATTFSLIKWLTNPDWQSSFHIFHSRLVNDLVRYEGLKPEEASEEVLTAFEARLARTAFIKVLHRDPNFSSQYSSFRPDGTRTKVRELVRRIPGARKLWRSLRALGFPGLEGRASLTFEALLQSSSPYHNDFVPVHRVLQAGDGTSW